MKDESDTILTLTNFMQRLIVDDADTDFDDSPAHRRGGGSATDKPDSADKAAPKQPHSVARQQSNQDSDSDLEVVVVPRRLAMHEPNAKASASASSSTPSRNGSSSTLPAAPQEEIPLNDLAGSRSSASRVSIASVASNSTLTLSRSARGSSGARSLSEASVEQAIELDENADPTRTVSSNASASASEQTEEAAAASAHTPAAASLAGVDERRERAGSVEVEDANELDDERNRVRIDEFEFVPEESLADAIYDISSPQPPNSFRSWTGSAFMGFTLVLF